MWHRQGNPGEHLMSGICGVVYNDRRRIVSIDKFIEMRDSMTHRGPDASGYYLAPGIALGSRRLAILDISERGHMPMSSGGGRYQITYNGEVYNYKEIRSSLETRGFSFRSNTDTEVLLNLYIDQGPRMLERLNGMFAFAIWDENERALFMARDHLGIKPVYYAFHGGGLFFASEQKALFTAGVPRQFDRNVWEELLCFHFVSGERTAFAGVRRLLPGHYLLWKDGVSQIKRWWNLADRAIAHRENLPKDVDVWFRDTFDSAVNLERVGDVPVGVLLSSGIDSGSVAASLATQAGFGMAGFTVRFATPGYDEDPIAQRVADRWQLKLHSLEVASHELLPLLRKASWLSDQPLAHANDIHLLAVSKYARSRVTVLLSGEGGDELLGGDERYQPLRHPMLLNAVRPLLPRLTSTVKLNGRLWKLSRYLKLGSVDRFILFNVCETLPEDLEMLGMKPSLDFPYREAVLSEAKALYPDEPMRQAIYYDQHTHLCSVLERNDRMTMGASIECRVPFLDYRLVETLAAVPSFLFHSRRKSKYILRRSIGARLPQAVLHHRKWGFEAPWSRYFRQIKELRDVVSELPDISIIRNGPFNLSRIKNMVGKFETGDDTNESLIRQLVMLAVWDLA
jgi:asparagine synthase (glutamine-hydrolysing)